MNKRSGILSKSVVGFVLASILSPFLVVALPDTAYAADACPSSIPDSQLTFKAVASDPNQVPGAPQVNTTTYTYIDSGGVERECEKTAPMEPKSAPISCAGTWDVVFSPGTCFVRALFAGIGSFLMWIGIQLVTLAGGVFEFVLQHAIVQFATTLKDIKPGLDIGWAAVRDVANIIIIGMFVFIAISIILGLKEYGEKKMIARVLIVAVLINFSLLFSKVIIDASNFMAFQFYNSMVRSYDVKPSESERIGSQVSLSNPAGSDSTTALKGSGIAGKFLTLLGVGGIADSYNMLRGIQEGQKDALAGLGYGLISFIFLVSTALVFFYGAFLIVSRAVLLVFLMLTSAFAFASYLVPKFAGSQYGWEKWWESLLKSALLAPLLMIFLWMTMLVAQGLVTGMKARGVGTGTLGALAADPSASANMAALFSFLLILGLLFLSFKAASMFSHEIAGFGMLSKLSSNLAFGAAFSPLLGMSRLTGLLGRSTIGNLAARRQAAIQKRELEASKSEYYKGPDRLTRAGLSTTGWLSKRTFDPLASKSAAKAISATGALVFGEKWGKDGIVGTRKRQAEDALKAAREMGFEGAKETREAMSKLMEKQQGSKRDEIKETRETHGERQANAESEREPARLQTKARLDAVRAAAGQQTSEQLQSRKAELERQKEARGVQFEQEMDAQRQRIQQAQRGTPAERAAQDELRRLQQSRAAEIGSFDATIGRVQSELTQFNEAVDQAGQRAVESERAYAAAHLENARLDEEHLDDQKKKAEDRAVKTLSAPEVAKVRAASRPGTLFFFGNPETDPAAKKVKAALKKSEQKEFVTRLREVDREHGGGDHGAAGGGGGGGTPPAGGAH